MNLSQLVKTNNWLREFVDQAHFPLREESKDDFYLASYKNSILNRIHSKDKPVSVSSVIRRDERRLLDQSLIKLSQFIDSKAQVLAASLDSDANISPTEDDISLENIDQAAKFFNRPALNEKDLESHTGQKVLGSFFRALDNVVRARLDENSFIGSSDLEQSEVLSYLETLQTYFEDGIQSILEKVLPETLFTLSHEMRRNSERFFTDFNHVFAAAEGSIKAKSKAA